MTALSPILRLLGTFELITEPGQHDAHLGRKGQALLGCVAAHRKAGASRSQLMNLLWTDHRRDEARNALRQCIHQVRYALGGQTGWLVSDGDRLRLTESFGLVDVWQFERLAATDDVLSMCAAAELYRGDLLAELSIETEFQNWLHAERERLHGIASALLTRMAVVGDVSVLDTATALARRLLASDPVHEGCYRALMLLYVQAGLRAKALQVWIECGLVLQRELAVAPSAETAALSEQLFDVPDNAAARSSSPPTTSPTPSGLVTSPLRFAAFSADRAASDHLLRGWQLFNLFTAESNALARCAFHASIELEAANAEVIAMLGWTHFFDFITGWTRDPGISLTQATHAAMKAVACNANLPSPHTLYGKILLWNMQYDAALQQLQKAVSTGKDSAYAHFHLAEGYAWVGQYEQALMHIQTALRLEPNEHGLFLAVQGWTQYLAGDLQAARQTLVKAMTRNPNYPWSPAAMAAIEVERGDPDSARHLADRAQRLNRRMSLDFAQHVMPIKQDAQRHRLVENWRMAGFPQREAGMAQRTRPK